MGKTNDYLDRIKKARKRRKGNDYTKYVIIASSCIILIGGTVAAGSVVRGKMAAQPVVVNQTEEVPTIPVEETTVDETTTQSPEELASIEAANQKQSIVDSYQNLGIVQVSGYLNMRKSADSNAEVIGKLLGDSACEILDSTTEGWYKISSGGLEGYISSEFVLIGEEAKTKALELIGEKAVINTEKLNVRKEPNPEAEVVGQVLKNERYQIKEQTEGWIQIPSGYISSDYVEVRYALNEARKLDLRSMVLNLYENIGISNVNNYLNIREEPKEEGKVIGKMTSKSAGEILETLDGWYKIKSGPVTGYVKSDYILTGAAAKDEALQVAELMAVVSTDKLNARTDPSTESAIWSQISNSERYRVLKQVDGWVEIELDTTSAYVATDYVDVRYALNEAIKFTPIEERVEPPAPAPTTSGSGKTSTKAATKAAKKPNTTAQPGNLPGSSQRNQIANYALQFLGNPYVWGGTSLTNGADCSGFTQSIMANFGVSIPRTSGSQAGSGRAISSSEMRPGDLIFYVNSGGTVNHVALYIGNSQVIHASNPKTGIKISNWNYRTPYRIVNVLGD